MTALEAALALLPGFPPLMILLAQAHIENDRPREAIPLLRTVLAWSHEKNEAVEELLAALGGS